MKQFLKYGVVWGLLLGVLACQNRSSKQVAFYHWKSQAKFNHTYQQTLEDHHIHKIYMHYFDVDNLAPTNGYEEGIFPNYVIQDVDDHYKSYDIVPVVYITNRVFQTPNLNVVDLAKKITELVDQISDKYFGKSIRKIQIDCDWTRTTKATYFNFLTELQKDFEIDVTIRLHQIKYKVKTGVPPVQHGTLMLYNMGDFKKTNENSILETAIVKQYVDAQTNYPLSLHLGLPLFSQTIVTNLNHDHKIIKHTDRQLYESDPHFKTIDATNFQVVKDTLYKGFYMSEGFNLKLEEISESEILSAYEVIQNSQLKIDEIIFYHLDETSLKNINFKDLMNNL